VRFRLVHKLATYCLASIALFTLASSGSLPSLTLILVVLFCAFSWHADPETRLGCLFDRAATALNIVTLILLAGAVFQVARSFPDVDLLPFLNFVIFLLVLKLWQRRGNRDYLQIYVLSFVVMLAASMTASAYPVWRSIFLSKERAIIMPAYPKITSTRLAAHVTCSCQVQTTGAGGGLAIVMCGV